MVYEKYIKRNGKLYGPYLYESKRVKGEVVTFYHGKKKKSFIKKIKEFLNKSYFHIK